MKVSGLSCEALLPLVDAIERATGKRPHPNTAQRWRMRGIHGVKLETVLYGGRRATSIEAVQRFIARVTAAADGAGPPLDVRTNRQREAAIRRAEAELQRAGV